MTANEIILSQKRLYPALCATDEIKALYQSVFGCGHMVGEAGLKRLKDEISQMGEAPGASLIVERIGDKYARAHLRALMALGLKPETLFRLFMLSAGQAPGSVSEFERALRSLVEMCEKGEIDMDLNGVKREINSLKSKGYPAVSHSPEFKRLYSPAYRVILARYANIIKLFCAIDSAKEPKIVAIDGRCASGKSTLGGILKSVYDCEVFHMDDFFLPRAMRTAQRLSTPGENVDHERILSEVLTPLKKGERFSYRPYDCATGALKPAIDATPGPISVVEGAYSLHKELRDFYDVKVFMSADEDVRLERILRRNGPEALKRFQNEWIPMEEAYFAAEKIPDICDLLVINQEAI